MKSPRAETLGSILLLCSTAASAASDLPGKLQACASQPDNSERLACYDKLAADSATHAEPAPVVATPEQSFGNLRPSQQPGQPPLLTQITSTVVKVTPRPNDRWAVTLENSQVWEQNETANVSLHPGDVVTIRKAAMGAHLLTGPSKVATYVRRIK